MEDMDSLPLPTQRKSGLEQLHFCRQADGIRVDAAQRQAERSPALAMTQISGPVGRVYGGKGNDKKDVALVQLNLNNWIIMGPLKGWSSVLPSNGVCCAKTIEAIEFFQKMVVGYNKPDGRIDPNGATLKALMGPLKLGKHLDPAYFDLPAKPPTAHKVETYDAVEMSVSEISKVRFGGSAEIRFNGQLTIVNAGEVWKAVDGDRLIVSASSLVHSDVQFIQMTAVPGSGKLIGVCYKQYRVGFQEDVTKGAVAGEVVRRTAHIQKLMRIEAYFLMGMLSSIGGTPVLLWSVGTNIGEFVGHNGSKFPAWAAAVGVVLAARAVIKSHAPVFYDKVVDALLLGAWKGCKIAVAAFGTDVLTLIPEAMAKDSEKLAQATGGLVAKLGQKGWKGKVGVFSVIATILLEVGKNAVTSLPVAVDLKATEIYGKLKAAGVSITEAEGKAIVLEFVKHGAILYPEMKKLKDAFDKC
jgi:hypothetical protein